jgi:cell shape-determining protein MreD
VKPLAHVVFALLLAGLQAAFLRWVGGGAFSLSLLAACVVYLGLHGGVVDGSVGAAGIGYVLDLMTGSPKGLMTFLAVLLFVLVRATSAAVDVRSKFGFAALSGVGALVLSLGALLLLGYTAAPEAAPGPMLSGRMVVEALLTAALAPLVLAGLRRIDGIFHHEEPGLLR